MPLPSHSGVVARTAPIAQKPPTETSRSHHNNDEAINGNSDDFGDSRPQKKRKIDSKPSSGQRTLDAFFSPGQPKPPNRVTIAQPHGHLIHTINGVRNELNISADAVLRTGDVLGTPSLTPQSDTATQVRPEKKEDKRTLRSHDEGPRLKSELATYFPNYEDVMFDTPRETEAIGVDTTIYITDDAPKQPKTDTVSPSRSTRPMKTTPVSSRRVSVNGVQSPISPSKSSNQYNGASVLDFSVFARNIPDQPDDPLREEVFTKSHKRAERKEKQLRNIERERAMHEKVQLERILDGLMGHDWLRVLGITGVTDGEARKYEPKRDYFIAEVQTLVNKFKEWKEGEKRQRLEKEAALAAEREGGTETEQETATDEGSVEPPSSDINVSASRQLQSETVSSLKTSSSAQKSKARDRTPVVPKQPPPPPPPPVPYRPPSPIVSFYKKRHVRDAALKKTRHGRNITAFGQPLPEMDEHEFQLPADYITEEVLRASAREKRRRKRESAVNAASSGPS